MGKNEDIRSVILTLSSSVHFLEITSFREIHILYVSCPVVAQNNRCYHHCTVTVATWRVFLLHRLWQSIINIAEVDGRHSALVVQECWVTVHDNERSGKRKRLVKTTQRAFVGIHYTRYHRPIPPPTHHELYVLWLMLLLGLPLVLLIRCYIVTMFLLCKLAQIYFRYERIHTILGPTVIVCVCVWGQNTRPEVSLRPTSHGHLVSCSRLVSEQGFVGRAYWKVSTVFGHLSPGDQWESWNRFALLPGSGWKRDYGRCWWWW